MVIQNHVAPLVLRKAERLAVSGWGGVSLSLAWFWSLIMVLRISVFEVGVVCWMRSMSWLMVSGILSVVVWSMVCSRVCGVSVVKFVWPQKHYCSWLGI